MNKLLTFMLFFLFLNATGWAQNSIDLENMDLNFSPEAYVTPFIHKKDSLNKIINAELDQLLVTKKENQKDSVLYYKASREALDLNSFKIDSLYHVIDEEKMWSDENSKKWAIAYNMMRFSNDDSTAYFEKVVFPNVSFIENLDGEFVAISASTNYNRPSPLSFVAIHSRLTRKYGSARVKKISALASDKYVFEWVRDGKAFILISDTEDTTFEETQVNVQLFVVNEKHNDFIKGKVRTSAWVALK